MSDFQISLLFRLVTFRWDYRVELSDSSLSAVSKHKEEVTYYSTLVKKPELVVGLFWDRIILHTSDGAGFIVAGIKKNSSELSIEKLTHLLSNYHVTRIEPAFRLIKGSYQSFKDIFANRYGYVRHSRVEGWKSNNEYISILNNEMVLDLLPEQKKNIITKFIKLFEQSHSIREKQNKKFIARELKKYSEFFDQIESNPLTDSQRLACIVNEDNNLVLAGAGSGKTSVIIAKAGYLIQSKLADPHEILILAYGRKASQETDERIKQKLPNIAGITTSTFHKLGLDIIGLATGKKPRISKLQEDPAEFFAFINRIVTELTKSDSLYNQRVIDYFVTHLIPYENEFSFEEQGDYFTALKDGDMRSLKSRIEWAEKRNGRVSLQQEQLKSFEEVVIADFLFVNGIKYIYEPPYKIDTSSQDKTQYQPDFYLPEYDIYIEHFGISRDGKTPPFVNQYSYLQGVEWKRELHKQHETTLVETYSFEMKEGVLTDLLYSKLQKHGVKFSPLTFGELLELLTRIGEEKKCTQFTKLIVTFLDLFKQSGHSFEALREQATQHPDKPRCHAFIDIFEPIYDEYSAELNRSNTVDFNDMIRKATALVKAGKYNSPYKYVLVDEFQDISAIRADLVKSIVGSREDTGLACVGDDWQSIYRFSGSDINYTSNFDKFFGFTEKIPLDKTFRFNNKINAFATTFITQNPAQLKKDVESHRTVPLNAITLVEYYQDVDRAIQHCVEDIKSHHQSGIIYILGRYSFTKPTFLQTVAKEYPEYKFLFDTVHGSKGKEADFVIIVDVNDAKYGFPSKIADDPLLHIVLPKPEPHEYAEERRLFYVAVTRAKHHSYVLYDVEKPSVFVKEIREKQNDKYEYNEISTEGVSSAPPDFGLCSACGTGKMTMRVMNNGHFFFGCGNYPFCHHSPRTCEVCNKYPLIRDGSVYRCQNPVCDNTARACQRCTDGMMVARNGKYGRFLGCSNYSKQSCKYTEK